MSCTDSRATAVTYSSLKAVSLTHITYQIGEVFVSMDTDETTEMIEKAKETTKEEIKALEAQAENHKKILQDLKVELYAKFGTNINLEAEED